MADLDISHFDEFFAAMNDGSPPYRWQRDLLASIADGQWPDRVVAPTGTGKSALIEIHVFLRALAVQRGRRHPRRLVLSVDRRALIDAQARRAQSVADALHAADGGIVGQVATLLRAGSPRPAGAGEQAALRGPLSVSVLRGGMNVDRGWLDDPVGCQILCITPDLLGSRLLFRGYLARRESWPRHAGLLAYDTMVVVDESHLTTQLVTTLRRIRAFAERSPLAEHVEPLRVLETTATPVSTAVGTELRVRGDAATDEALNTRLTARKTLQLAPLTSWPLPRTGPARRTGVEAIVAYTASMREGASGTTGVVLNRVRDAVQVATALRGKGFTVATLVGPMRPFDRSQLEATYPGLLTPRGNSDVEIIVATQTVEVGVDVDLAGIVTDIAPGPSLVQRLGRVNRRGLVGDAPVVVLLPENPGDVRDCAPYEGADVAASVEWLTALGTGANLSPAALDATDIPSISPRRLLESRLTLSEATLLSHGSDSLVAEPDLEFWLSDSLEPEQPAVSVVGRALPSDTLAASELLTAVPPTARELYPTHIGTARRVLAENGDVLAVLIRDREVHKAAQAAGLVSLLRAGDILVLPEHVKAAADGVIVDSGVDGRQPLGDVAGLVAADHVGTMTGEALHRVVIADALSTGGKSSPAAEALLEAATAIILDIDDKAREFDQVAEREASASGGRPTATWDEVRSRLPPVLAATLDEYLGKPQTTSDTDLEPVLHHPVVAAPEGVFPWLAVSWRARGDATPAEIEEFSPESHAVLLGAHQRDVAERAGALAASVGLPDHLERVLSEAGLHHDDGKIASPFQARLGRRGSGPALAKSGDPSMRARNQRVRGSLPVGWRHEQLSVAIAWELLDPEHRDLVARLIGTSHGRGRTDFPHATVDLLTTDPALQSHRDVSMDLFDRGGWDEVIADMDATWGPWGVAYLEALLRAADIAVSKEGH